MRYSTLIIFILICNTAWAQKNKLEPPSFSYPAGLYTTKIELNITENTANVTIYYTTDGSEPSQKSKEYKRAITIDTSQVIRAKAFKKDYLASNTATASYLIHEHFPYAVVSLSLNPEDLWDEKTGIYVEGPHASAKHPHYGANYWKNWEKRGHVEFWDTNSVLGFSQDIGIRIFGGWSRTFPQKSFKLYAKEEYGDAYMKYPIFPDKPIKKYKRIALRNGGSDCDGSHFRDEFMIGMMKNSGIDIQAYRPAVVFLNGQYWGIYFIREKVDEYFIAENHHVDKDSLDMIEKNNIPKCGTLKSYNVLLDYLKKHDLHDSSNFAHVKTLMDWNNYLKFSVAQVYFQNRDAGGNTRCWKSFADTSKWRWIMYDVDLGYGRFNKEAYTENSFKFCTDPKGPNWPNPPWSTFLLRKMFESDAYKIAFINQMCDNLNSIFYPDTVLNRITYFKALLEPEMDRHQKKWGWTLSRWQKHIDIMNDFAVHRPMYIRKQMLDFFHLNDTLTLTLDATEGGNVKINSLVLDKFPWMGIYFNDIPIPFSAIAKTNYRFVRWKGINDKNASCMASFNSDTSITAIFEAIPLSPLYDSVSINEIAFHAHKKNDAGDWIELVNTSSKKIDLSGCTFKGNTDNNAFLLPSNLILQPNQYLVLCSNVDAFENVFPNVINAIGNFPFELNKQYGNLRLFDKNGDFIDSLTYNVSNITNADSLIKSLSLRDPLLSNTNMENWIAYNNKGTPGMMNTSLINKTYEEAMLQKMKQERWNQYRLYATIASAILLLLGLLLLFNEKRKKKMTIRE